MLPSAFPKRKNKWVLKTRGFEFLVMQRHYLMLILYHVQFHVLASESQAWKIAKVSSKMFGLEAKEEERTT